ncbi:MAG TPA: rhomboid family intramembrane serine protease [Microscillaceae bacterium]|nr:rhomboid family intramembrane serine protease [Microscillaceae bacterium]
MTGLGMTPVVRTLLIINIGVFIFQAFLQIDVTYFFGLRNWNSPLFAPHQFVTYMFLHGGLGHIFGNMFALFMFGPMLEYTLGTRRFLIFYMVAGIGAGVLNTAINGWELQGQQNALAAYVKSPDPDGFVQYMHRYEPMHYNGNAKFLEAFADNPKDPAYLSESVKFATDLYKSHVNTPTVGASGAVFGLLIAFALLFPNIEMMLLFFPVPIKAKYFVTLYLLYEIFAGLGYSGPSNVAHFAHISGALVGFLLIKYWKIEKKY